MIKKLKFNKWVTNTYIPIYILLLGAALMFYYSEVLKGMETSKSVIIYTITIAFMIIVGVIGIGVKKRKNKREIDPLIKQLAEMLDSLSSQ